MPTSFADRGDIISEGCLLPAIKLRTAHKLKQSSRYKNRLLLVCHRSSTKTVSEVTRNRLVFKFENILQNRVSGMAEDLSLLFYMLSAAFHSITCAVNFFSFLRIAALVTFLSFGALDV